MVLERPLLDHEHLPTFQTASTFHPTSEQISKFQIKKVTALSHAVYARVDRLQFSCHASTFGQKVTKVANSHLIHMCFKAFISQAIKLNSTFSVEIRQLIQFVSSNFKSQEA